MTGIGLTHDVLELGSGNVTIVVLVKDLLVSSLPTYDGEKEGRTLKASLISSSESVSCIFLAIRVMNSAKSIELVPSAST
jgi:hypothetical protein